MRYQLDQQRLRLRLSPAEFRELLESAHLQAETRFLDCFSVIVSARVLDHSKASLGGDSAHWRIGLPRASLSELAGRLPCRDGLTFELESADGDRSKAFELIVDVDLHDKRRV